MPDFIKEILSSPIFLVFVILALGRVMGNLNIFNISIGPAAALVFSVKSVNKVLEVQPAFRQGHYIGALVLCIGLERRDDAGYDGQKCHEGEEYQAEILNNDPDDSACAVMFVVSFHLCHFTLPPSSIFSLF